MYQQRNYTLESILEYNVLVQGVSRSLGQDRTKSFVKCISNCNITPYGVFGAMISPIVWCVDDGYLLSALWSVFSLCSSMRVSRIATTFYSECSSIT